MVQGVASYPGVNSVVACRYTRGLGTLPGHAILEFNPQSTPVSPIGTLRFTFGSLTINLFRCKADFGSVHWSAEHGQTAVVKILDRRWAWHAGGAISGRYNIPFINGEIDTRTEATPQQLATLLLNEMQEQNFDVSSLPNDVRPAVNWDFAHPATELDRLCELLGCRVALKIETDTVEIVRLGEGSVPDTTDAFRFSQTVDLAEAPDSLRLVTGLARFQSKLKLQAIGQETIDEGSLFKPINDLSYAPTGGWGGVAYPYSFLSDPEQQQLAQRTIWKYYQIVSQADDTQEVPDFLDVLDIENIKPIDDYLVETYEDDNNNILPQEAYVEGVWWNGDPQGGPGNNTPENTRYEGDFAIDRENGIVRFPVDIYKLDAAERKPAELFLTCSYHAREPNSLILSRYVYDLNLGGSNNTGPRIIRREDLVYSTYAEYDENNQITGTQNNLDRMQGESLNQLTATATEFAASESLDIGYNGIKQIDIDGLVRQVTFRVECRDEGPRGGAETYASLNSETDPYVPKYRKRRGDDFARVSPSGIAQPRRFPRA